MQVFVVGAARSGTTRLKVAISDALGLPRTSEGHFYPVALELDAALDAYFDRLSARAGAKTMVQRVDADALRLDIHAAVRRQFEAVAGPAFVEKSPGSAAILALPVVAEQWPAAKIVFARRRGIENVISSLYKFPHWSFEVACQIWTDAMLAWSGLDPALRGRAIEVDQADMACEPNATAARLGAYLGLDAAQTAAVAKAFTQRAHPKTNTRVSSMEELQQAPVPLAASPWTEEQRATFVALCGPAMQTFGYGLD
jgi:hypothetical protein